MSKITVDMLRKVAACTSQIQLFEQLFPEGVTPTVALCVEHASKFDWDFASRKFLLAPALEQYEAASAPALVQYEAAKAQAWAQYEAAKAPAWAQYEAATAPALAQYEAAKDQALAQYEAATAQAWAEQWITQCATVK